MLFLFIKQSESCNNIVINYQLEYKDHILYTIVVGALLQKMERYSTSTAHMTSFMCFARSKIGDIWPLMGLLKPHIPSNY